MGPVGVTLDLDLARQSKKLTKLTLLLLLLLVYDTSCPQIIRSLLFICDLRSVAFHSCLVSVNHRYYTSRIYALTLYIRCRLKMLTQLD